MVLRRAGAAAAPATGACDPLRAPTSTRSPQDWLTTSSTARADARLRAAVIVLDTPGGLAESMRKIVQRELSPSIPVIVYVSPNGARAASAGVWISAGGRCARDGAGDQHRLVDADHAKRREHRVGPAAQGRERRRRVAARRSRRATAATRSGPTRAVRKASNLTAPEALQMHVIDLIAPALPALLNDDRRPRRPCRAHFTLHTANAAIVDVHPGFFTRFLVDADRPEHRRRCCSSPGSPGSVSSSSTRAS